MSYAQQLLLKAEADFNNRRAGIERHATSIDALYDLLTSANEHGIAWLVAHPEADCHNLLLTAGDDDQKLLDLLLELGATVTRNVEGKKYTHYTLCVPGVVAAVDILTARAVSLEAASAP